MTDVLPGFSSGGPSAGTGGVNVPNTLVLPPVKDVPPGPATTEQARAFASVGTLATVADSSNTITAQCSLISAAGKYVPLSYGHQRWSGYCYFFDVHPSTGALVIGLLLGEGEFDAFLAVEVANAPLRSGCTWTGYTGTAGQAVDATIAALVAAKYGTAYADALPGIAHVVLSIAAGAYTAQEFTGVDVEYRGKKVFDSRDGTQTASNTATWKYSTNAGVVLVDFLSSGQAIARNVLPRYGRRCAVDATSAAAVANVCDQLIGNAPNQKKRSELHITLMDPTANEAIEQTMRTYALCFVDRMASSVTLIADVARSPVLSVDQNDIIKYEAVGERQSWSAPTMYDVTYTDTSVKPWRKRPVRLYDPRVLTGEIPEIPGTVDLSGSQSFTQVQGLIRRRLATTILSVRTWGISLGAKGYQLQKGDVFSATHPLGMTGKQWVVDTVTDRGFGEVHAKVSEYDAGVYADFIQPNPATLGSGASTCSSTPALGTLTATQQSLMELQTGGGYACILRGKLSWPASTYPCLAYYEAQVLSGATLVDSATVGVNGYTTIALATGTYTAQVRAVSGIPGQAPGAWSTATLTIAAATCSPVPTQKVWESGSHGRVYTYDSIHFMYLWSDKFTRTIRCDAPLTTVTRTELWFAWGTNPSFASATKVRDDAGTQTAWTLQRAWKDGHPTFYDDRHYCTLALGTSPTVPGSGTFNAPGSSPAGTYTDALASYSGTGGNWFPPTKAWVRFVNGTAYSDPVELRLAKTTLTYPDNTPANTDVYGYLFSGSGAVSAGSTFSAALNTGYALAYTNFAALAGSLTYSFSSPNHSVSGVLFDSNGDLISGYAQWQAWKV